MRNGKNIAACLVKSTIKKGRETVPTSEILSALQLKEFPNMKYELIKTYQLVHSQMDERLDTKW